MQKIFAALTLASLIGMPLSAAAQDLPSYAISQAGVERIQGRISSFDGQYTLVVRDERGFLDRVRIHPGTIINPTGITLRSGMVVSIIGSNNGDHFSGDEVDTPYTLSSGVPFYQNHAWNYYGSGFALGYFFANSGWWHGNYFSGYNYAWRNGYRYYGIANYYPGIWQYPGSWVGHRYGAYGYGGRPIYQNTNVNVYNGYSSPRYNAPTYNAPTYNAPAYNAPTYNGPRYNAPGYNAAGYNAPTYNGPRRHMPNSGGPVYRSTGNAPRANGSGFIGGYSARPVDQRMMQRPGNINSGSHYGGGRDFGGRHGFGR